MINEKLSKLKSWVTLASEELFSSRWLRLRKDVCRLPSDRVINDFFVVEVPDGAAIVVLTEKKELVLVRQYKHGFGQIVLELPAGIVEMKEDPMVTVARELQEETGYMVPSIEYITTLITKPSRLSARTLIYFASGAKLAGQREENDSEVIETVLVPIAELTALIQRGDIVTETSLAALLMVWDRLT